MQDYLLQIANELGVSLWVFMIIILWSLAWKLLALWKSARKGSVIWFVLLAIFNTIGILPILYYFIFSEMKCCKTKTVKKKSVKRKKKK